MSRAFALKARTSATVLHSSENYASPPQTGIWARIEFPALRSGYIDEVRGRILVSLESITALC
jgi:hypothetical protein